MIPTLTLSLLTRERLHSLLGDVEFRLRMAEPESQAKLRGWQQTLCELLQLDVGKRGGFAPPRLASEDAA